MNPLSNQIALNPGTVLPGDVMVLKIMSLLKRSELFNAMRVCKQWFNFATDARLWQKEITLLVNAFPGDEKKFEALGKHVGLCYGTIKEAEPFLEMDVKIGDSFHKGGSVSDYKNKKKQKANTNALINDFIKDMKEKSRERALVVKASKAIDFLCLLGKKSSSEKAKYGVVLQKKYGSDVEWMLMAISLSKQGKWEDVFQIVDTLQKNDHSALSYKDMFLYCQSKKFNQAIEFVKKFPSDLFRMQTLTSTLLFHAYEAKDLIAVEKIIDELVTDEWIITCVCGLIEKTYESKNLDKARELVTKYLPVLKQAKQHETDFITPLIEKVTKNTS